MPSWQSTSATIRMKVEYRPAAKADLDAIAIYTKREWGKQEARAYLGELRAFASSLADFPHRYPRHASRLGTLRKASCGDHLIFYTVSAEAVEIVRVLHNRVDVNDHFA